MLGATLPAGCQPLAQPGTVDTSCPASPKVPLGSTGLEIAFPGCCRPDNVCGYQVDGIPGLLKIGLGCIDSAPFLDGGSPQTCGDIGAAGANGEAGSGGLIGYAGAAGDTSSGGTNGGTSGSTSGGSGGSSGSESGSGGTSGGGTGGTGG